MRIMTILGSPRRQGNTAKVLGLIEGPFAIGRCIAIALALLALASPAPSEVVRLQIDRRKPLGQGHSFGKVGPYETITGRLFFEVSPDQAANRRIVDLKLAPKNGHGRVEFWSDFFLLTPADPSRGNRRLFYEVNNRGNKLSLGAMNDRGGTTRRPWPTQATAS